MIGARMLASRPIKHRTKHGPCPPRTRRRRHRPSLSRLFIPISDTCHRRLHSPPRCLSPRHYTNSILPQRITAPKPWFLRPASSTVSPFFRFSLFAFRLRLRLRVSCSSVTYVVTPDHVSACLPTCLPAFLPSSLRTTCRPDHHPHPHT